MEKTGRCGSAERGRGYGHSVITMEDNLLLSILVVFFFQIFFLFLFLFFCYQSDR
jgi:hypothetical protein